MNEFLETEKKPTESKDFLWVEKYRPVTLSDYIGDENIKAKLEEIIESNNLCNLLLYGSSPGTGKTTAAKLIVNNIDCDYLYLNCSDTNGIDDVRNKIKGFASTQGFSDIKVIICDESDFLTTEAQAALRNIIETFSVTTRFIFTCNYVEKIIPALRSRCQEFEVVPPSKKELAMRLKYVLEKEDVKFELNDLAFVVNSYYPDMRKILNFSQQYTDSGTLRLPKQSVAETDIKEKIINELKSVSRNTFSNIRQLIADADVKHFDSLYKMLYDNISDYAAGKEVLATLIIAEFIYQSALVVDKEITFMACIARLIKDLK